MLPLAAICNEIAFDALEQEEHIQLMSMSSMMENKFIDGEVISQDEIKLDEICGRFYFKIRGILVSPRRFKALFE